MRLPPASRLVLALAVLAGVAFAGGCDKASTMPANTALSAEPGKDRTTAKVNLTLTSE